MIIDNLIYKLKKLIVPYKMAIITVVISVLATAVVSGISSVGKTIINDEMNGIGLDGSSIVIYGNNMENLTDVRLYKDLGRFSEVKEMTPVLYDYANVKFNNEKSFDTITWGVASDAQEVVSLTITEGRMINSTDNASNAFVCLIDEEIGKLAYKRSNIVGKNVQLSIGGKEYSFTVIGSVKKGSNLLNNMTGDVMPNFIYIPYTTMQNISLKNNFDQIIFKSNNPDELNDKLPQKLYDLNPEYMQYTIKLTNLTEQKTQVLKIVDTAFLSLFIVSCVAILVCSISVGASVNTAVSIRQKDIGVKMSLGASRWSITMEFLCSAIFSCIIGVFIAVILAFLGLKLLSLIIGIKITFDYLLIILSIFATIVLTTIFSLFPSYKAANLDPIKALNRE